MKSKKTIFTVGMATLLSVVTANSKNRTENIATPEPVRNTVVEPRDTVAAANDSVIYNVANEKSTDVPGVKPRIVKTQADVLHNKIVQSAKPIIIDALQELERVLAPYWLNIDWNAQRAELMNILSPYGEDLDTPNRESARLFEYAWNQNEFLRVLLQKNKVFSKYDERTQAEIQRFVIRWYVGTMRELKQNRVALSKQFAEYYPVLNLDDVPQDLQKLFADYDPAVMQNGNKISYGYKKLSNAPVSIERKITVRSGNINPAFFNVDSANYELISVGKYRWQVSRTLGNTVETSPAFYCVADFDTVWTFGARDNSFVATAYGAKPGVQISVSNVLYQRAATKNDKVR